MRLARPVPLAPEGRKGLAGHARGVGAVEHLQHLRLPEERRAHEAAVAHLPGGGHGVLGDLQRLLARAAQALGLVLGRAAEQQDAGLHRLDGHVQLRDLVALGTCKAHALPSRAPRLCRIPAGQVHGHDGVQRLGLLAPKASLLQQCPPRGGSLQRKLVVLARGMELGQRVQRSCLHPPLPRLAEDVPRTRRRGDRLLRIAGNCRDQQQDQRFTIPLLGLPEEVPRLLRRLHGLRVTLQEAQHVCKHVLRGRQQVLRLLQRLQELDGLFCRLLRLLELLLPDVHLADSKQHQRLPLPVSQVPADGQALLGRSHGLLWAFAPQERVGHGVLCDDFLSLVPRVLDPDQALICHVEGLDVLLPRVVRLHEHTQGRRLRTMVAPNLAEDLQGLLRGRDRLLRALSLEVQHCDGEQLVGLQSLEAQVLEERQRVFGELQRLRVGGIRVGRDARDRHLVQGLCLPHLVTDVPEELQAGLGCFRRGQCLALVPARGLGVGQRQERDGLHLLVPEPLEELLRLGRRLQRRSPRRAPSLLQEDVGHGEQHGRLPPEAPGLAEEHQLSARDLLGLPQGLRNGGLSPHALVIPCDARLEEVSLYHQAQHVRHGILVPQLMADRNGLRRCLQRLLVVLTLIQVAFSQCEQHGSLPLLLGLSAIVCNRGVVDCQVVAGGTG
mmetsp:Transcript_103298/g.313436  ORF Transcript_103298/g.313436 Transcript_103298/m.313436 type:complete len:668 (-) Transcript_103298:130-2133(-)